MTDQDRQPYSEAMEGLAAQRDYDTAGRGALVALLDKPWRPPYIEDSMHRHNCTEVGVCLAGEGDIYMAGRHCPFSAGAVLVVPAGLAHRQINRGAPITHWRYLAVEEDRLLRALPEKLKARVMAFLREARKTGMFLSGGEAAEEAAGLMQTLFDLLSRGDKEKEEEAELYLMLLMSRLSRRGDMGDFPVRADPLTRRPIEPALAYIAENYARAMRVSDLARVCALSESRFRRVFVNIIGMSPARYVTGFRVNRAQALLRLTNEPVQNIAVFTGFQSQAAFFRSFKRATGMSAAKWREAMRGNGVESKLLHVETGQEIIF